MKPFVILLIASFLAISLATGTEHMEHEKQAAEMKMSNNVTDHCSKATTCVDCTSMDGCNFCAKGAGESFCTSIIDPVKAGCVMPGCSADTFIQSLPMCSGGCQSAMKCGDCTTIPGCGWCHDSPNGAQCMEIVKGAAPASCKVWGGKDWDCTLPCEMRDSCDFCLNARGNRNCQWCENEGKCSAVAKGTEAICSQKCAANVVTPPVAEVPLKAVNEEGSNSIKVAIGVLVVGAVMGVIIIGAMMGVTFK